MNSNQITLTGTTGTITISPRSYAAHQTATQMHRKPRLYVHGESFDLLEDLTNRGRRPYKVWRDAVRLLNMETGGVLSLQGMRWSQYAGCSCPCSPGFVLEHQLVEADGQATRRFDVWVELKNTAMVDPTKPSRELVGVARS